MKIYEFLGVLILLFIAVLIAVPRYEYFADAIQQDFLKLKPSQTNTTLLYQSSAAGETNYLKSISTKPLEFENQLLIMDRCLKFKIEGNDLTTFDRNLVNLFKNVVFPVKKEFFEVTHFAEVETRIMQHLQRFYSQNSLTQLNGPIYALIFQAPYLRIIDKDCNVRNLSVQYNAKAYENTSYSIDYEKTASIPSVQEKCITQIGTVNRQKVNILLYLLFPTYNKSYQFVYRNWENIQCNMRSIIDKRSFEGPCFIKCYEQGENKTCGCLNQETPYEATCLSDNKDDLNLYNYGNLYLINSEEASRRVNGSLGTSFFGENVHIKAFDPNAIDLYNCSIITKNPMPIQNISS
uniref:Uncharacterized protein n=1 Tax=viral metagenome TaxID=1070528 RepID=A0A6C0CT25_9ZZZZ